MLPFKLIYHPRYDLDLGPHVFPSQKFKMVQMPYWKRGWPTRAISWNHHLPQTKKCCACTHRRGSESCRPIPSR